MLPLSQMVRATASVMIRDPTQPVVPVHARNTYDSSLVTSPFISVWNQLNVVVFSWWNLNYLWASEYRRAGRGSFSFVFFSYSIGN